MAKPSLKEEAVVKRIKLKELLPDAQNRRLREWRVDDIARNFDFGKWTPPICRDSGNCVGPTLVDGHHGVAAACKRGLGDVEVICYVHPPVESDERVAEMYIGISNTLASTPAEKFLYRLRAKEPIAMSVFEIIQASGFEGVSADPTDGFIHTPTACEWVYKGGMFRRKNGPTPAALAFALTTTKLVYGKTRVAVRPDLIRGFGCFAHRYPELKAKEVAQDVRVDYSEYKRLVGRSQTMKDAMRCELHKAMALVIRQAYNTGRTTRKLEEW